MTISVSGWVPSNVQVVKAFKSWGSRNGTANLVKFQFSSEDFPGTQTYVSQPDNFPFPAPGLVGLNHIDYVIPICPFHGTTAPFKWFEWSCVPPTGVTGGGGGLDNAVFKLRSNIAGGTASGGPTWAIEMPAARAVSSAFGNAITYKAYGIFVGK